MFVLGTPRTNIMVNTDFNELFYSLSSNIPDIGKVISILIFSSRFAKKSQIPTTNVTETNFLHVKSFLSPDQLLGTIYIFYYVLKEQFSNLPTLAKIRIDQ